MKREHYIFEGEPPKRPKSRRRTAAWYRKVGMFIAFESGADSLSFTEGEPLVSASYHARGFFKTLDPSSHRRLYEFACGCGHVALGHYEDVSWHHIERSPHLDDEQMSPARRKSKAEQWAIAALRRCGLEPPRVIPRRPSTEAVQEGRRAAAKRYREVAADLAFEVGVKEIEYDRRSLSGFAYYSTRRIRVPEPTTRRRLYIFAHECAHIALAHEYKRPKHLEEYEAEHWAIAALRRHGVQLPRKELLHAKWNVARRIWQELRRGSKATDIDKDAMRFAGVKVRQLTVPALRARVMELRVAMETS